MSLDGLNHNKPLGMPRASAAPIDGVASQAQADRFSEGVVLQLHRVGPSENNQGFIGEVETAVYPKGTFLKLDFSLLSLSEIQFLSFKVPMFLEL